MPLPIIGSVVGGMASSFFMRFLAFEVVTGWVMGMLKGIGVGFVSYVGFSFVLDKANAHIFSQMAGLPVDVLQILNIAGFTTGVNMILAAHSSALVIKMTMGSMSSKATWKRPSNLEA